MSRHWVTIGEKMMKCELKQIKNNTIKWYTKEESNGSTVRICVAYNEGYEDKGDQWFDLELINLYCGSLEQLIEEMMDMEEVNHIKRVMIM